MRTLYGREVDFSNMTNVDTITMAIAFDNIECNTLASALVGARRAARELMHLLTPEEIGRLREAAQWIAGEAATMQIRHLAQSRESNNATEVDSGD